MEKTINSSKDLLKTRNHAKTILPGLSESKLQQACIKWFDAQYSSLSLLLFSVPNGGKRETTTIVKNGISKQVPLQAKKLNAEGLRKGVSDLILHIPKGEYASLCIEMKSSTGEQSPDQKMWQKIAEKNGHKYIICRSLEQFMNEVNNYLQR